MVTDKTSSDQDQIESQTNISLWQFEAAIASLNGRILTIIEASMGDIAQREAVKSLIKKEIWGTYDAVGKWHYEQALDGMGTTFPYSGNRNKLA